MNENNLVQRAREFAARVHTGQFHNHAKTIPYIAHPEEVAGLVIKSGGTDVEIAAAWLHDVVEDTPVTIEDIRKEFGNEVAEIVNGLTDFPEIEKLPIVERKAKQAERVLGESVSVRLVKLADQTSNVRVAGLGNEFNMDLKESREYIAGAKRIADNCRGISEYLDGFFLEIYAIALNNLENSNIAREKAAIMEKKL